MSQREAPRLEIGGEFTELGGGRELSQRRADDRGADPAEVAMGEIGRAAPHLPQDLETSRAKLVYVYIWMMDRVGVEALSRATRLPQIRLFPVLETLVHRGHVERDGLTYSIPAVE